MIGRYVELKKAGRNYKGLCPFHGEKTPSFNVSSDRQIFHCFGCGEGGDAISFLMRHDGLSFPEAARILARECGIEIEETESGERGIAERVFAANELALAYYRESLESDEGADARAYLAKRGLDPETIRDFDVGFAPDRWDGVASRLEGTDVDAEVAEQAGLLVPRRDGRGRYDRLRGRVVFPIRDVRGRVIGFGGRALGPDQEPKYLNTPESPVFHKRRAFYGFPHALEGIRRSGRAIVCEGYFDRVALHRAGMSEGLATCGTALTQEHGADLRRRTKQVVLLFDGDAAGEKAVERALELLLPHGLRVKAAALPAGHDPDTYLAEFGPDALQHLIDKAPDALEVLIARSLAQGFSTPVEKADAVGRVTPFIALLPNRIERDEYTRRLAIATNSDPGAVQSIVRGDATGRTRGQRVAAEELEPAARPRQAASKDERHLHDLAVLLYRHPDVATPDAVRDVSAIVPEGSWKAVVQCLLEAAEAGRVDESGAVDLFALGERLDADATARLREVAVSERFADGEHPPERILRDLLRYFGKRELDAELRELTRRMREPGADVDSLLHERQRLQERARRLRAAS